MRSVAFGAWVRAATLHESAARMGLSHMLEHMVFKGTESRSAREISLSLETLGGSLDAYTAREHTSYQARVLDEHVRDAASVIGDVMFEPLLRDSDLRLERKVVLEEIAMVDDTPDDLVFEVHNERLFGDNGYGYRILGTRDTVSSFTTDDLRSLHAEAYRPDNVVIAAAGSIEHDELVDILGETGWLDRVASGEREFAAPPASFNAPSYSHVERPGAQTQLVFGSSAPAYGDANRYAFCLVSMLLGGGMSSRLFQHVREELGLAYAVHTFSSFYSRAGMHGVYVGTSPESADEAAAAVLAELERVAAHGVPADELSAGKQQLKGQITLSLETPGARMYRAAGLELYGEPFRSLDDMLSLVDAIDEKTVSEVCAACFAPSQQTVVSLGPAPLTIL
ncbi:MAG: insulinase family protein [Gemmatimonadota bacterium]|nr:insulinase family protein [Gemmatimonadota bacterium]